MGSPTAAEPISVDSAPDADALAGRHAGRGKPRDLRPLVRWLNGLPDPRQVNSYDAAAAGLEAGVRWLRSNTALLMNEPPQVVRLRLLVDILEEVAPWRRALGGLLARICSEGDALPLFESGLPND